MNRWGGGFDGWRKSKGSNEEQKKEWGKGKEWRGGTIGGITGQGKDGSEGQEDLEQPGNVLIHFEILPFPGCFYGSDVEEQSL